MRVKIPPKIEIEILIKNKRCCCICKIDGLTKKVHIHHIDGDSSNNDFSNLAVLCFEHHSDADAGLILGKYGSGRKLKPEEVRSHKALWEDRNEKEIDGQTKVPIEFSSNDFEKLDKWTASFQENNDQGADYRDVILKGDSIGRLRFSIKPRTSFWRAGFKLSDPNGSIFPLRSNNSFLFHLGSVNENNRFGITAYNNGEHIESVNKTLQYDPNKEIDIGFEVNKNNFIKCYVNGVVECEPDGKMSSRLFKKVYLVAWGDENDYKVEFEGISLKKR